MADTYANYADLAAHNTLGQDYLLSSRIVAGARGANIAIHGGAIEYPTTQLADYCATALNSSFYSLQGVISSSNSALHISSNCFDEPGVSQVLRTAEWTVSWHGTSGSAVTTYLGAWTRNSGPRSESAWLARASTSRLRHRRSTAGTRSTSPTAISAARACNWN